MDIAQFKESLSAEHPPESLSNALKALWYDANDDWHTAHAHAQAQEDADGSWVHAYLHRKEGDQSNAGYWYRRAGKPAAVGALDDEWLVIVAALTSR
jgi:hypothetical protein